VWPDAFLSTRPVDFHPASLLVQAAFDIAQTFQRTVYDALYLALAVAEQCDLITADESLQRSLQGTKLQRFVVSLGSRP
jgi:predicted nucleic acid-binding protein